MEKILDFPKNVFSAFAILFFISAAIIPIQNLVVWGPAFVVQFYTSPYITAEKLSIVVIGIGVFMMVLAYKKQDSFSRDV